MNIRVKQFLVVVALVSLVGCSGEPARATVQGKVELTGKGPLPGGKITFALASNPEINAGGVIQADGTYEVINAPVGECKVIISNQHLGNSMGRGMPMVPGRPGGMRGDVQARLSSPPAGVELPPNNRPAEKMRYVRIAEEFSRADSTPLRSTVTRSSATPSDFQVK
jgi:hypothetical protein